MRDALPKCSVVSWMGPWGTEGTVAEAAEARECLAFPEWRGTDVSFLAEKNMPWTHRTL